MNIDYVKSELERGTSVQKIADALGCTYTKVRYHMLVHKLRVAKSHLLNEKFVHLCKDCGQTDPTQFSPGRYVHCKKCRSNLQNKYHQSIKSKIVEMKGGCCCICGYSKCNAALDLHHRDPSQKDPEWKKMRGRCIERVKDEITKCDLVCRNCHAEIHYRVVE